MLIKVSGTFGFEERPAIGTEIERSGVRYILEAVAPYVGRNGPTTLLHWQGQCADCGAPFPVTTGMRGIKDINTRCRKHHAPGVPSTKVAAARKANGYKKRSAAA